MLLLNNDCWILICECFWWRGVYLLTYQRIDWTSFATRCYCTLSGVWCNCCNIFIKQTNCFLNCLVNNFLNWLVDKRMVLCITACLPVPTAWIAVVATCLISSYIWWKLCCFYLFLKEQVFNTFLHLLLQICAQDAGSLYWNGHFVTNFIDTSS